MEEKVVYAKLEDGAFIAGTDLESISKFVNVNKEEVPSEYSWHMKRLEKFPDWRVCKILPLIKNFEESDTFEN